MRPRATSIEALARCAARCTRTAADTAPLGEASEARSCRGIAKRTVPSEVGSDDDVEDGTVYQVADVPGSQRLCAHRVLQNLVERRVLQNLVERRVLQNLVETRAISTKPPVCDLHQPAGVL